MHQRIITVLAILFGLSTAIFGALYFQKENGLPKLPTPASSGSVQRSTGESASLVASDALYYPYYFGAPQYVYQYQLDADFPAVGETLPVYTVQPQTYDRAAAVALAAKFGFNEAPIEQEGVFIFSSGTTPESSAQDSSGSSSGSGSAGIPSEEEKTIIEPSEPTIIDLPPEQVYDGTTLTIMAQGYVSFTDYSVSMAGLTIASDTVVTTQKPEGVADADAAITAAVAYLRTVSLLPEAYETSAGDPNSTYQVTITPTRDGYPIQSGAISVTVGDASAIAYVSLRAITTAVFSPYPLKTPAETLSLQTLTYRITKTSLLYASAYADDGTEYAQPVYVLTGTDSLGNDFTFEIPAIKAEFLEQNKVVPLREEFPTAL